VQVIPLIGPDELHLKSIGQLGKGTKILKIKQVANLKVGSM
jgi:hypothetical protein